MRAWERRDVEAVTAACQDPEIPRYGRTAPVHGAPCARLHRRDRRRPGGRPRAGARDRRPDDSLSGARGHELRLGRLRCEIGYRIAPEVRRRGIGARATRPPARGRIDTLGLGAHGAAGTPRTMLPSGSPNERGSPARACRASTAAATACARTSSCFRCLRRTSRRDPRRPDRGARLRAIRRGV